MSFFLGFVLLIVVNHFHAAIVWPFGWGAGRFFYSLFLTVFWRKNAKKKAEKCRKMQKKSRKMQKNAKKICTYKKKVLPLHQFLKKNTKHNPKINPKKLTTL